MSFPRYESYKDSGVEWLGEVPGHWQVQRLGQIGKFWKGNGATKEDESPAGVPCIRYGDLYTTHSYFIRQARSYIAPERMPDYTPIQYGDVLFAASGETLEEIGKSAVNLIQSEACCGGDVILFRAKLTVDPIFIGYATDCCEAAGQKAVMGRGFTVVHIYADQLKKLYVALPPLPEQSTISAFLDRETAKIDALIAEQQRLIELLKEKRQAVISHAVTKGLNPDAPMKDSGIEWLGEVPEHWNILPFKRDLAFLTSGSRGWADHYSDDGALFIRIGNLTRDSIGLDLSDIQRVSVPEGTEGERTKVRPGDVLFSITAYLGSVAVIPENLEPAYVSQHVALARLKQQHLLPEWAAYVALSFVGKTYLETQGYGGTKIQLSLDDVANLVMTVPDIEEQSSIITFLDREIVKLDALTAEAQTAIILLRERRTALISAAVTGKIDVRGLVAAQPQVEQAA